MVNDSVNTDDAPERVTPAQLARIMGVSPPAVNKAEASGRISKRGEDGKFDRDQAIAEWKENTRPAANQTSQAPKEKRKAGGQSKYSSARARKEHALAQIAEINLKKRQGLLVELAGVEAVATDIASLVRQQLENLPGRLAPTLVGHNAREIEATLERAVDEVLEDLSRKIAKLGEEIA